MTDRTAKQNAPTNASDSQQIADSPGREGNTHSTHCFNAQWGAKIAKTEKVNFFPTGRIAQMLSTGNNQVIDMQSVDRSADIFNGGAV